MTQPAATASFSSALARHRLELCRQGHHTLQINLGLRCNQTCRHCHLEAGPGRPEMMDPATMEQVIAYAQRCGFKSIDVTGGAPELNPHLRFLLSSLRPLCQRLLHRANLTALWEEGPGLMEALRELRVIIYASLPALSPRQTDGQRGPGIFERSVQCLRKLNQLGWGRPGSPLELHLVSNPTGAFLPPDQCAAEKRFRRLLDLRWGISFTSLSCFANVPLGRFKSWLQASGNLDTYLDRLVDSFNAQALDGVMCRTLVSVDWQGYLYDCDFHLAAGLPLGGRRRHVSQETGPPEKGSPIVPAEHCYTCTAGAGFT